VAAVLTGNSFDYIPRPCKGEKQFTVHMPSRMHEGMAGALSDRIVHWYGDIRKGQHCEHAGTLEATKTVARKLQSVLATRVEVDDETRQEPDLSFTYDRGVVAGLIIEVAWSQSLLRLPERADRYIKGLEGDVRTVVGISLNDIYNGGRRAWFSVWQAQFDRESQKWTRVTTVDHQVRAVFAVLCRYDSPNLISRCLSTAMENLSKTVLCAFL